MITLGAIAGIGFSCIGGSLITSCLHEFGRVKRNIDYAKYKDQELDEKTKNKMNAKDHAAFIIPIVAGAAVSAGLSVLTIAVDETLNTSNSSDDEDDIEVEE